MRYLECMNSASLMYLFLWSAFGLCAVDLSKIEGINIITSEASLASTEGKKALVVVFLSAKCPCSDSHISEIKDLASVYPDIRFIGVNSNLDESEEFSRAYFKKAGFSFPVIKDKNTEIADRYSALKTPHAFVLNRDGQILYQGGVSSSRQIEKADRKYLREALEDIHLDHEVRTKEGRTLGCTITRGKNDVW